MQIVAHRVEGYNAASSSNAVDGDPVPVPHFGAALSIEQFHQLAERLRSKGVSFIIEPHLRFTGQPGEQVCWHQLAFMLRVHSGAASPCA